VDRCDGMLCEHDGNCFSGCCALFVANESKRCMPLVNGDMCPIAIDVVDPSTLIPSSTEKAQPEEMQKPKQEEDEPLHEEHYEDPDEEEYLRDHPSIGKAEHQEVEEDSDDEE